jgi:hypothetical protein
VSDVPRGTNMHGSQNDYPGTYMLQRYSAFFSQKKKEKKRYSAFKRRSAERHLSVGAFGVGRHR